MKVICEGINLSEAVSRVVKACATKTPVPVMECIKISAENDSLSLSATDGEIFIMKKVRAEILEEGSTCVPGRFFADFVKKLEGLELTLVATDRKMTISYGKNRSDLQTMSSEDFPVIDTDINENYFKVNTALLKKAIEGTTFCCATDESRPIFKGCQILLRENEADVTAIDGFRLATYNMKIAESSGENEIVCPARTLNEIDKMLAGYETTIYMQKNHILVNTDDTVVTSRLYSGDFIKKENIIPSDFGTVVVCERETLKNSIERASVYVRGEKNCLIIFNITEDRIQITSTSEIGNVDESVPALVTGKDLQIAMNSRYITEALSAMEEEKVEMKFNTPIQPFICQGEENKDALYLILPVRTGNNA
ncbi:MAG: DNA polymerase III subunit beta [Clostridia bacterium]|nr:DNA polymerase III subunit beta [Clostridia bacterium]